MAYELIIDKPEVFNCKIQVEGGEESTSKPRLIMKSNGFNYIFEGTIDDGEVNIPLNKLNKILKEGQSDKLQLEIVVDDTLLVPWEGEYSTKISKKAVVEFNQKSKKIIDKPKINVVLQENKKIASEKEFLKILKENKINNSNLKNNTKKFTSLLKEYISENNLKLKDKEKFIDNIINEL